MTLDRNRTMSLEERKALREKHIRIEMPKPFYGGCATCLCYTLSETPELVNAPWPCDVIKELDASENADISCDTESTGERICEHDWVNKAGAGYRENPVEVCVKCGIEL